MIAGALGVPLDATSRTEYYANPCINHDLCTANDTEVSNWAQWCLSSAWLPPDIAFHDEALRWCQTVTRVWHDCLIQRALEFDTPGVHRVRWAYAEEFFRHKNHNQGAMPDNLILNSPFRAPDKHWRLDESGGFTQIIEQGRRRSQYFVPIARTAKRAEQGVLSLDEEDESGRSYTSNDLVNEIRSHIDTWRQLPPTVGKLENPARSEAASWSQLPSGFWARNRRSERHERCLLLRRRRKLRSTIPTELDGS